MFRICWCCFSLYGLDERTNEKNGQSKSTKESLFIAEQQKHRRVIVVDDHDQAKNL